MEFLGGVVVLGPVYCAETILSSYTTSEVVEIPVLLRWPYIPVDSELYQNYFSFSLIMTSIRIMLQPTKSIYSVCHLCPSIEFKIIKPKDLLFTFTS
jgi:hypothetical protein